MLVGVATAGAAATAQRREEEVPPEVLQQYAMRAGRNHLQYPTLLETEQANGPQWQHPSPHHEHRRHKSRKSHKKKRSKRRSNAVSPYPDGSDSSINAAWSQRPNPPPPAPQYPAMPSFGSPSPYATSHPFSPSRYPPVFSQPPSATLTSNSPPSAHAQAKCRRR